MTATQQRREHSWSVLAAMRRTARTLRYVNDELVRANEAIFRPAGAAPPPTAKGTSASAATAVTGNPAAAAAERTGRAA